MPFDREQLVDALAEMTADERRDIVAEASGQAADPKIRAAQALRTYLHGPRRD